MPSSNLAALLKLPADERAKLAMALWDSLTDEERESELELTAEEQAELDHRWADHLADPESAIPWEHVRRKLRDGK
jgi:putative addiction module component (TIGR02574 family)